MPSKQKKKERKGKKKRGTSIDNKKIEDQTESTPRKKERKKERKANESEENLLSSLSVLCFSDPADLTRIVLA